MTCNRCRNNWCWYCGDLHDDCRCGHNEHK